MIRDSEPDTTAVSNPRSLLFCPTAEDRGADRERLSMPHIHEVLRLHHSVGMSQRTIARSLSLAQGTVCRYLNLAGRSGLTWPLPPELNMRSGLRAARSVFPSSSDVPSDARPQPDWALVHHELRRRNITLMLLWDEYCDSKSDSFSYLCSCERYRESFSTCAVAATPLSNSTILYPRWLTES